MGIKELFGRQRQRGGNEDNSLEFGSENKGKLGVAKVIGSSIKLTWFAIKRIPVKNKIFYGFLLSVAACSSLQHAPTTANSLSIARLFSLGYPAFADRRISTANEATPDGITEPDINYDATVQLYPGTLVVHFSEGSFVNDVTELIATALDRLNYPNWELLKKNPELTADEIDAERVKIFDQGFTANENYERTKFWPKYTAFTKLRNARLGAVTNVFCFAGKDTEGADAIKGILLEVADVVGKSNDRLLVVLRSPNFWNQEQRAQQIGRINKTRERFGLRVLSEGLEIPKCINYTARTPSDYINKQP